MTIADILTLYDYNYWANARVLAAASGLSPEQYAGTDDLPDLTPRRTLIHQLDVEWSWRLRWQGLGEAEEMTEGDFPTVGALVARWRQDEQEMRAYLAGLDDGDLDREIAFPWAPPTPLWYYLFHVVNHGTQARGDAAVLLTRLGRSPGDLEFAIFVRERQREQQPQSGV
jgi:uncharacterized damage-inducible protein DinB